MELLSGAEGSPSLSNKSPLELRGVHLLQRDGFPVRFPCLQKVGPEFLAVGGPTSEHKEWSYREHTS